MNESQTEAVALADSYCGDVGLPLYSDLLALLHRIAKAHDEGEREELQGIAQAIIELKLETFKTQRR